LLIVKIFCFIISREDIDFFQMESFGNGRRDYSEHQINNRPRGKKWKSYPQVKGNEDDLGRKWGTVPLSPSFGHEGL